MAAKQPPPLMKKHSQTDLVSRLKTRKILGVGGEDDDGEVHRSKVRGRGEGSPRTVMTEKRPSAWANRGGMVFSQHLTSAASFARTGLRAAPVK